MERRQARYIASALFILALAVFEFVTYTSATTQQSTFNLQPGLAYDFSLTRNPSDYVSGQFQETSGQPVSFYIQTSAQFAAFQAHTSFDYLYSVEQVPTGRISYSFSSQDTFYLLFRHGTALVNSTETIFFQRSYVTHITSKLFLGLIFVGAATVDLAFAFVWRRRKPGANLPFPPQPLPPTFGIPPHQQPNPPVDAPTLSNSSRDGFVGGVAGLRMYRFKGQGGANSVSSWHNPWGYGVYFTDKNLVGVSYTKYLSRAYKPGWILSLAWIGILAATSAFFAVTHVQDLPLWWVPIFPIGFFGCMFLSFAFLLYLSPKRANNQIDQIQVKSITDVEALRKDLVLRRDEISEINIDHGYGISSGAILSIRSKTYQPVTLVTTNKEKLRQLMKLVQDFADRDPVIRVTTN